MTWDEYFLKMAELCSQMSKDPSTKMGAVIVNRKRVVSTGFNGFPSSMPDLPELYANREEKYSRIVHCEMNALIYARQDVRACTLYTWPLMSCDRCVVHMLQAGICRFVAPWCDPESDQGKRWEPCFQRTRKYIHECGAVLLEVRP